MKKMTFDKLKLIKIKKRTLLCGAIIIVLYSGKYYVDYTNVFAEKSDNLKIKLNSSDGVLSFSTDENYFLESISQYINSSNTIESKNNATSNNVYVSDIDLKDISLYRHKDGTILSLNIEEYVLGVLAAEVGKSFPLEALKAQAVAARTYAYKYASAYGNKSYSGANGADLIDNEYNQVYISPNELLDKYGEDYFDDDWSKLVQAVEETKGEVITYEGEIIQYPLYFASAKDKTEDNLYVFGSEVPYLKSVKTEGDEKSYSYFDESTFTVEELASLLKNSFNNSMINISLPIKNQISIIERTSSGKPYVIKIGEEEVYATELRRALSLKSVAMEFIFNKDNSLTIKTEGYGHGVGMSQWGAFAMASEGVSYKKILSHYYTGTKIGKLPKID